MSSFTITTTRRVFTIEADSAEHAHAIVTGKAWPVGIPPAPQPAEERYLVLGFWQTRPTAAWKEWFATYQPRLWGERLAWAHGECLMRIEAAQPADAEAGIAP